MLDKGKVNYSRVSIVQAYDLNERLEELKIKRDEVTIASVDAINMYPSIKISTIKKAVRFFARKLTAAPKKNIITTRSNWVCLFFNVTKRYILCPYWINTVSENYSKDI